MKRKILFLVLIVAVIVISGCAIKQVTEKVEPSVEKEINITDFHLNDFVNPNFLKGTGTINEDEVHCSTNYNYEKNSYKITVHTSAKCRAGNYAWFTETFTINTNDKSAFRIEDFPVLNCDYFSYMVGNENIVGSINFSIERSKNQTKLIIEARGYTGSNDFPDVYNNLTNNLKQNFVDCNTPISEG